MIRLEYYPGWWRWKNRHLVNSFSLTIGSLVIKRFLDSWQEVDSSVHQRMVWHIKIGGFNLVKPQSHRL